jgi:hypothetical protein
MTTYALLLERPRAEFQRGISGTTVKRDITVSCAVVGEPSGRYGKSKTYNDEAALNVALHDVRIADVEMNSAVQAVVTGGKGFAYITYDTAQSLGLLEDAGALV